MYWLCDFVYGTVLCHTVQCPDSATKDDLLAYLDRISLYCHQLNITSKVKADVQNISGELIVSGVCLSVHGYLSHIKHCHFVIVLYHAAAISKGFVHFCSHALVSRLKGLNSMAGHNLFLPENRSCLN